MPLAFVLADRTLGKTPPAELPTYRRLTFDRGTLGHARFAPDGNTVVYDAAWRGEPSEVFTARIDSRESRSLGLRGVVHAVSSSSELAVGLESRNPFGATLGRVPLAGGAPREVLENVAWADWSPDGAELAAATLPLRPALSLHSRIVAVKGVRPGEASGYGLKGPFEERTTIAVVPAGYADGLDLRLAGHGFMLVRGRRAPIVGSVCMDMTMIDVTGTDVAPGDEVVIVGSQGGESIGVREIAAAIGTIPYELLCRVGSRIERVYD